MTTRGSRVEGRLLYAAFGLRCVVRRPHRFACHLLPSALCPLPSSPAERRQDPLAEEAQALASGQAVGRAEFDAARPGGEDAPWSGR